MRFFRRGAHHQTGFRPTGGIATLPAICNHESEATA